MDKKENHTIIQVKDVGEMRNAAKAFLLKFNGPGIFSIRGDMAAGKTTFVAAVCNELGLEFQGSPTFSIVNEYKTQNGMSLFHFDLYRIQNVAELVDIGFNEYLSARALVLIEWPEIAKTLLPSEVHEIVIHDDISHRTVQF